MTTEPWREVWAKGMFENPMLRVDYEAGRPF